MSAAPFPSDEAERLVALRRLGLLDTAPDEAFDSASPTHPIKAKTPPA
jgi:hypothetical protein